MGAGKREKRKVTYLDLKLKGKDANGQDIPVAWFVQTEKQGDNFVVVDQFDFIEGYIVKFEPVEFKYTLGGKEKTGKKFKMEMYDSKENRMYEISFGYTGVWRGLMNSLYSAKELGWIVIEVFVFKGFPMMKVYKDSATKENELRWRITWEQQRKYIKEKRDASGDMVPDYYDLDEKFKSIAVNELTEKIHASYDVAELTKNYGTTSSHNEEDNDPLADDSDNPDEFEDTIADSPGRKEPVPLGDMEEDDLPF